MATVTRPASGDSILAAWGDSVADAINGMLDYGQMPYAWPLGWMPGINTDNNTALIAVAAGLGGAVIIPFWIPSKMLIQSVSIRQGSVASLRSCEGALYQDQGSTTLARIAGTDFTLSYTPAAIDDRTANISVPGTAVLPGVYYLAIRNTSAAQTFQIRRVTETELIGGSLAWTNNAVGQAALGATLSVAANWNAAPNAQAARINGRVFGQSAAFYAVPRQTADLVALILAVTVALVVLATAAALLWIAVTHPDQDTSGAADAIGRIVGVVVGVLAGYIAGRRVNGAPKQNGG